MKLSSNQKSVIINTEFDFSNTACTSSDNYFFEGPFIFNATISNGTESSIEEDGSKLNQEEIKLIEALKISQKNDWKRISRKFFLATKKLIDQDLLRNKFNDQLPKNAKGKRTKFTASEDSKLRQLIEKYGQNWIKISDFFPTRDPISLRNRYFSYIKSKRTQPKNRTDGLSKKKKIVKPSPKKKINTLAKLTFDLNRPLSELVIENGPPCMSMIDNLLSFSAFAPIYVKMPDRWKF